MNDWERAVSFFELEEAGKHNASIPWEEFGVTYQKGVCRWCGGATTPRATWCREHRAGWPDYTPCANAVYDWWFSASALRRAVFKRDHFTCVQCAAAPSMTLRGRRVPALSALHMDHIVPIADGGRTIWSNLQTLCKDCHKTKTTKENRERKR